MPRGLIRDLSRCFSVFSLFFKYFDLQKLPSLELFRNMCSAKNRKGNEDNSKWHVGVPDFVKRAEIHIQLGHLFLTCFAPSSGFLTKRGALTGSRKGPAAGNQLIEKKNDNGSNNNQRCRALTGCQESISFVSISSSQQPRRVVLLFTSYAEGS